MSELPTPKDILDSVKNDTLTIFEDQAAIDYLRSMNPTEAEKQRDKRIANEIVGSFHGNGKEFFCTNKASGTDFFECESQCNHCEEAESKLQK